MFVNSFSLRYDIICLIKQKKEVNLVQFSRIRDLREDSDLTQKQVADILKTSANYYGDYEKGKRDIPATRLLELANFYNVSLDYITGRTNDKRGLTCSELSEEETELIKKDRSLSEKRKGRIIGQLDLLAEEQAEETATTRDAV